MTKKEKRIIQEKEAEAWNLMKSAEVSRRNEEQIKLFRAEWAGISKLMIILGVEPDNELRKDGFKCYTDIITAHT